MAPERLEYKTRQIELRDRSADVSLPRGDERELMLDGQTLRYFRMPNGQYVLEDYSYDPADDPVSLAKRYVDYQERVEQARRDRNAP